MKLELISCQASSDATAQPSSDISRTVLDLGTSLLLYLFTGLPFAGWLFSPVPARRYLYRLARLPSKDPSVQ